MDILTAIMVRQGVSYPLALLRSGLTQDQAAEHILQRYKNLDVEVAHQWIASAMVAKNAGWRLRTGQVDSAQFLTALPPAPDVGVGRYRYTITIEGIEEGTGKRVFRTIPIYGDGYLTLAQLEELLRQWLQMNQNRYSINWEFEDGLHFVIDAITQGIKE